MRRKRLVETLGGPDGGPSVATRMNAGGPKGVKYTVKKAV